MKIKPLLDTLRLEKISDETYFSKKYSNYISNSRLGLINPKQGGSPEKFFAGFKPIYSGSLDLGSAVHQMSLQSKFFEICKTVDKPTAKVGVIADKIYNIFKGKVPNKEDICKIAAEIDYYHGLLSEKQIETVFTKCKPYWADRKLFEDSYTGNKELIYLDPRTREIACNCIVALKKNQYIQNLLYPKGLIENPISENEQAILLDVEIDGKFILKIKAKLDNYTIDKETNTIVVNDIKTLGRIVSDFSINVDKYRYNRELSLYSWLLSLCANKFYDMKDPIIKGNYLVVSTIPQYYTKIVPMTKSMYNEGWKEFVYLLKLVAKSVETDYKDFGIWISKK